MKRRPVIHPLSLSVLLLLAGCKPAQFGGGTALPDGSVYRGELHNGLFQGEGELTWPDGRHYTGAFEQGLMSGRGHLDYGDGCSYDGDFANGNRNGEGRYECGDGVWSGRFEQGQLLKGSASWTDGETYSGEFQNFQPNGQGQRNTADGAVYRGTFAEGYLVQGSYQDPQGYRYRGGFDSGYYNGEGELIQPDGTVIRANFEYGQASGEGERIHPDADGKPVTEQGYFANGDYYPSEAAWHSGTETQRAATEARLYSEAERLHAAFTDLAPQRPGTRDIYALIVGGDGSESVFALEVNWVSERLGGVFDLKQHQIRLTNGSNSDLPLATRTSVRESLAALDKVMDPSEDLLLVHIVSHGDSDGNVILAQPDLELNNLSVADGKQWLGGLHAKHQWIVVSACYSGLWKNALANPERVVFTSAAADRTSFGCGDDSQRTWFSSALYGDALDQGANDPAAWFAAADKRVTEMEKEQGIEGEEHSLPQVAVGQKFLQWWQQ
ncbi:C13 family peptidase [Microbulbifer sp. SAOS-129_SWC]|uniref:C13 family peptidase n=1 Tax=Microbulbifer sp. SAOS-129_SWC TaxID=3145235 RepID=UPI0032175A9A